MAQPALNLTDEQRAAIFARGVSIALSAGAGCGKTFVLTERFLSHLAPPSAAGGRKMSLAQMVAITFTDRAAREMRDRIRKKCHERLMVEDEHVDHWLTLLRQLEAARVSTIHSFCGSLLRSHSIEAGLDPRFGVLDPNQASTLLNDLLDDELRRQLTNQSPPLMDLIVHYGLRTLRNMVQILLGERQAIDFDAWQSRAPDELLDGWQQFQEAQVWPAVLRHVCRSPAARTLLRILRSELPTHAAMRARCQALNTLLPELERTKNPAEALDEVREQAKVQGGGGAKAWSSEEVYHAFRDAATKLRSDVDKARAALNFDATAARPAAVAGLQLLAVARPVIEAYQRRKEELGLLDFDDLLIRAHNLLTATSNDELRQRVAAGIELLLVDEFQDTDGLQVELVKALCGERLTQGKLFFVGDHKQSIYRFRGAKPIVFRDLRDEMPKAGRLPLSRNFRSQPAILHFVNALFESELAPPAYEPLVPDRTQVGPEPAIEFLWAVGTEGEDAEVSGRVSRLREREADWIARRLRAIVDSREMLVYEKAAGPDAEPTVRAVRPGDIAILFRALSDVQYYEAALRRYALEYYVVGGHAFYAQQEVFDILNLLRTIASPADAVSLAGVLRSPIFSLDDETLFWLAQHEQGLTSGLFTRFPRPELSADQQTRVRFAAQTLNDLRAMRDRVPIAELVQQALARTGYDATLLAEFLGQRKLANLKKLIDQARSMDRAGIFTLADFIAQLSDFVVRQPDEALAATQAETANVVRLMSIHQSKGLEFPVVVVPDLERKSRGSTTPAAFDRKLGPLVRHPEGSGLSGLELWRLAEEPESAAEQTRLLYVATTRAADYLILSSGIAELTNPRGAWTQLLAERFDLTTGQFLARLPAGYKLPLVRVTTTEPELAGKPSGESRRPDLDELVERARAAAATNSGEIPASVAAIPPDRSARGFSFSRLTGQLKRLPMPDEAESADSVEVAPSTQLDATGLGTLVHEILASWDWAIEGDVARAVERHAGRHLTEDAAAERVDASEMFGRFVKSGRANELRRAGTLHREIEFLVAWPPERVASNGPYLHGVIDCLYQDELGNWHILDYKTNRVSKTNLGGEAAHYEMQMLIYAWAAERILGVAPASLTLHFLRPGLEHAFAWNDAARHRAAELVERAIGEVGSRQMADGSGV